jgi:tRNA threonylcarbamoyladenosine biosynthesis protein TsaB
MIILTIRTDKPEAEIGLYDDEKRLAYEVWLAHRQLAETLHAKIAAMLASNQLTLQSLQGIVAFEGPGSFTGLRIGLTVANALAYGLELPIAAGRGDDWIRTGYAQLRAGTQARSVLPHYGAPVHITVPKA